MVTDKIFLLVWGAYLKTLDNIRNLSLNFKYLLYIFLLSSEYLMLSRAHLGIPEGITCLNINFATQHLTLQEMEIFLIFHFNRDTKVTDQTIHDLQKGIKNKKHLTVLSLDFEYFLFLFLGFPTFIYFTTV